MQRQICVLTYRILMVFMHWNLHNIEIYNNRKVLQTNWKNTLLKREDKSCYKIKFYVNHISDMKMAIINWKTFFN